MNRYRLVPNYQSHHQILTSEFSILLFLCIEYRDSIGMEREGQYEQRIGREHIDPSIYFDRGVSVCRYTSR